MIERLKTAVIVKSFPALSETFILNRITGLINRGHDVDIYAKKPRISDKHVQKAVSDYDLVQKTHYEIPPANSFISEEIREIKALISMLRKSNVLNLLKNFPTRKVIRQQSRFDSRKKYDIIHAFFGINGLIAMHARRLGILDGPIAVSFHGFDLSKVILNDATIYNELFQEADLFLPVCEFYKQRLIDLNCPVEKIKVHPSAIDVGKFVSAEKNNSLSEVKIISIGRLVEKKGFKYSIKAVAEYIKENPSKEITYKIIGSGHLKNELVRKIKSLKLSQKIQICDSVNQEKIVEELQNSDIFICPCVVADNGVGDTLPNVIKEAMACELPVIASRHGGIPELVIHQENGFLTPEKDIQKMKEAIERLVNSPKLRVNMGKNGRKFVEKNYEIESQNDIILEEYKKLVKDYSR